MSVVRLIVATRSSCPPASGKIVQEMPGSVASGTPYIKMRHMIQNIKDRNFLKCSEIFKNFQKFLKMFRNF